MGAATHGQETAPRAKILHATSGDTSRFALLLCAGCLLPTSAKESQRGSQREA